MSMTESEAIEVLRTDGCYECSYGTYSGASECGAEGCRLKAATKLAIKDLSEIQQYRAIIGLTPEDLKALEKDEIQTIGDALKAFSEWNQYKEIGTVSEFRELKEKAKAKKKDVISCPICGGVAGSWSEGKE